MADEFLRLFAISQVDHRGDPRVFAAIDDLARAHFHRDALPVGVQRHHFARAAEGFFPLGGLLFFIGQKKRVDVLALELGDGQPEQFLQCGVSIDNLSGDRDDDGLESGIGEHGQPFRLLLGPLLLHHVVLRASSSFWVESMS